MVSKYFQTFKSKCLISIDISQVFMFDHCLDTLTQLLVCPKTLEQKNSNNSNNNDNKSINVFAIAMYLNSLPNSIENYTKCCEFTINL